MKVLTADILVWSVILLFGLFLSGDFVLAEQEPVRDTASFYENRKQGFYWYHDDTAEQPDEKMTVEQMYTMKPEEFRKLMEQKLETAVQYPAEHNVYEYMVMLDISKKKAQTFSSVTAWVGQNHPELSNQTSFPVSAPGQRAWFADADRDMDLTLEQAREKFALIMFSSPACSYCDAQSSILEFFTKRYKWKIKKLDLKDNMQLAERFGIQMVPSLILLHRDTQKVLPAGSGVISMEELKNNIYQSVLLFDGKITKEQYGMKIRSRNSAEALGSGDSS